MENLVNESSSNDAGDSSLGRMQTREIALRQKALQLQAKAEHLERQRRNAERHLHRRIDAHEKIVLGALVKKAGLDIVIEGSAISNDNDTPLKGGHVTDKSATYNREYILGAMLWLASALKQQDGGAVKPPNRQSIVVDGRNALANDG